MKRTCLRNRYLKTEENNDLYKRQRNLCTRLIRRSKRNYYNNLDSRNLFDNMKFWNIVKLFSEKTYTCHKITLIDDDNVVSDDKETCMS